MHYFFSVAFVVRPLTTQIFRYGYVCWSGRDGETIYSMREANCHPHTFSVTINPVNRHTHTRARARVFVE